MSVSDLNLDGTLDVAIPSAAGVHLFGVDVFWAKATAPSSRRNSLLLENRALLLLVISMATTFQTSY